MNPLVQAANGVRFFTGFLPSFTAIGHRVRRFGFAPLDPDFSGQRWLVTGASTGLGAALARAAAAAGAEVVAVARNEDRLAALAETAAALRGAIVPRCADLSSVAANDALADEFTAERPVDVLVNNVGVLLREPATTDEGLDLAFATNLLGPWHLTERLRAGGALASGACVITMSSGGLYNVRLSIRALERQERYDGVLAYAYHKRAQLAVNHHWRRSDDGVDYYVMHPGWAKTPGVESSLPALDRSLGAILRTPEEGVDTALWLAATRPVQRDERGLWFDRALRSEHLLWGTRGGAHEGALLAALAGARDRALGASSAAAA
ncbi:MAG: SDR family NAD(P)-dependent oxidoreductase [Pseudomonadales bacterium]|jgi:dehydrogenase/reductase SDR family protein 12|nr:SDR family NAD(P)-dependent oxidoreductase [Pseudomonadales bacterium]